MTAETLVFERLGEAYKAWGDVPKDFMRVDRDDNYTTYRCPKCGIVFAQVSNDTYYFRFNEPIICCGRLLI